MEEQVTKKWSEFLKGIYYTYFKCYSLIVSFCHRKGYCISSSECVCVCIRWGYSVVVTKKMFKWKGQTGKEGSCTFSFHSFSSIKLDLLIYTWLIYLVFCFVVLYVSST